MVYYNLDLFSVCYDDIVLTKVTAVLLKTQWHCTATMGPTAQDHSHTGCKQIAR